jgi:hypothetical protein
MVLMFWLGQQSNLFSQTTSARLEITHFGNIAVEAESGFQYQLEKTGNLVHPIVWESTDEIKIATKPGKLEWSIHPYVGKRAYYRVLITKQQPQQTLSLSEAESKVIKEVIQPERLSSLVLGLSWGEPLNCEGRPKSAAGGS